MHKPSSAALIVLALSTLAPIVAHAGAPCPEAGVAAAACRLERLAPAACASDVLPASVVNKVATAAGLLERALAEAKPKKARQLARRAGKLLGKALAATRRAGRTHTVSSDCAAALTAELNAVQEQSRGPITPTTTTSTISTTTTTTTAVSTSTTLPLDVYVMLDQSGSMGDQVAGGTSKFEAVASALIAFAQQPGAAGVGIGIQYFGLPPTLVCSRICNTDGDCGSPACGPCDSQLHLCLGATLGDSCAASDYATPAVEIATLPGVATDLANSLAAHAPGTGAATSAALQGAVDHATTWATAHPDRAVVDLLITDSDPAECDTVLGDVTAIATQAAAGTPPIRTYVIAIGTSLTSPNAIAAAGGTSQAFVVDTSQAVSQQVGTALGVITGR